MKGGVQQVRVSDGPGQFCAGAIIHRKRHCGSDNRVPQLFGDQGERMRHEVVRSADALRTPLLHSAIKEECGRLSLRDGLFQLRPRQQFEVQALGLCVSVYKLPTNEEQRRAAMAHFSPWVGKDTAPRSPAAAGGPIPTSPGAHDDGGAGPRADRGNRLARRQRAAR
jgi:hypothetical protein